MLKEYSQIANLLGGSGVEPHKRKEIIRMVEKLCNMYEHADESWTKTVEENQKLIERNRELEKKLAEAVTGKPDFGKYAYLVESDSYKKLEKIREILESDADSYDYEDYGEDR